MRFIAFLSFVIAIVGQAGCCQFAANRRQPPFEAKHQVWQEIHHEGFTNLGDFVLSKGESTSNGAIGVRVSDVTSLNCMSPFAEPPQAVVILQLYDARNDRLLCEKRFLGTGDEDFNSDCQPDGIRYSANVRAISTKDGWVSFELRRIDR